jgi:hypothetical protein
MSSAAAAPAVDYRGKLADPEWRRARARKARAAQSTPDAHIRALVEAAPELTPEQVAQLRTLLHAGTADGDGS